MDKKEKQLIAQYAMLQEKESEIKYQIQKKRGQIDQDINQIEAYKNLFSKKENERRLSFQKTEKDSEYFFRTAPFLEPSFSDEDLGSNVLPLQIMKKLVCETEHFYFSMIATAPVPTEITLVDIHSYPDAICIGGNGFLRIYNIFDGSVIFNWEVGLKAFKNNINCISYILPDFFAIGSDDGFVRVFNMAKKTIESEFCVSNEPIIKLLFSSSKKCICLSKNGELSYWSCENTCVQKVMTEDKIKDIKIYPVDGNVIVVLDSGVHIMWELNLNRFIYIKCTKPESKEIDYINFTTLFEVPRVKIIPNEFPSEELVVVTEFDEFSHYDKDKNNMVFSAGHRFCFYKVERKSEGILKMFSQEMENNNEDVLFPSVQVQYENPIVEDSSKKTKTECVKRPCITLPIIDQYLIGNSEKYEMRDNIENPPPESYKM